MASPGWQAAGDDLQRNHTRGRLRESQSAGAPPRRPSKRDCMAAWRHTRESLTRKNAQSRAQKCSRMCCVLVYSCSPLVRATSGAAARPPARRPATGSAGVDAAASPLHAKTHSRMRGCTNTNKSARFCSRAPRCMSGEALVGMLWRQPCCRRHGQPAHGRSGDEQPADEPDQSTKQVASHRVNVDFSSS